MIDVDSLICPPFVDRPNQFTLTGRACVLNGGRRDLIRAIESEIAEAWKEFIELGGMAIEGEFFVSFDRLSAEARAVYGMIELYANARTNLERAEDLIRAASIELHNAGFAKFKANIAKGNQNENRDH